MSDTEAVKLKDREKRRMTLKSAQTRCFQKESKSINEKSIENTIRRANTHGSPLSFKFTPRDGCRNHVNKSEIDLQKQPHFKHYLHVT